MLTSIPATLMRGGTSKGLYFAADDLPSDETVRNAVLLAAMGSPDQRQIDGVGGAHPLTSKIAILSPSRDDAADVDYLFLQVAVEKAKVSDTQPCGNILAGVGPWAIENGLVDAQDEETFVRIRTVNNNSIAVAKVSTPGKHVTYQGKATIDGVPGTAAPIPIDFLDVAGSNCGALLPTGNAIDKVDGLEVTCIDNGMPVILIRASDLGLAGNEAPADLEANSDLKERIERLRLEMGPKMNLGDVTPKTVPKMTLIAPPTTGGTIMTRSFIPHRVHEAIGVLGAVSVATACAFPATVATPLLGKRPKNGTQRFEIEHPTGFFTVDMEIASENGDVKVNRSALLRTANKLMKGEVYIPASVWSVK